jgi:hypothetical protein
MKYIIRVLDQNRTQHSITNMHELTGIQALFYVLTVVTGIGRHMAHSFATSQANGQKRRHRSLEKKKR